MRLITRDGNDFTRRFPFIEMAVKSLPVRSCLIDGALVFNAACQLGCEGRSGRSPYWLKVKNPKAAAVMREAKEARPKKIGCAVNPATKVPLTT